MEVDINGPVTASAFAVLLHPHPDYGGSRFHPFVSTLYQRLPAADLGALRFDFSSSDSTQAHDEVVSALDSGADKWPGVPAFVVGYSFGAGIAATVVDRRVAGWYLLAPPAVMLTEATVGADPRPKSILVPERDQFSPPESIERSTEAWQTTSIATLPGADHFLGNVAPAVDQALRWVVARAEYPEAG